MCVLCWFKNYFVWLLVQNKRMQMIIEPKYWLLFLKILFYCLLLVFDRSHFVLNLKVFKSFTPGKEILFWKLHTIFFVAAIQTGRSLKGQQTIFYHTPNMFQNITNVRPSVRPSVCSSASWEFQIRVTLTAQMSSMMSRCGVRMFDQGWFKVKVIGQS